jgi:hypothetical protein
MLEESLTRRVLLQVSGKAGMVESKPPFTARRNMRCGAAVSRFTVPASAFSFKSAAWYTSVKCPDDRGCGRNTLNLVSFQIISGRGQGVLAIPFPPGIGVT